MRRITALILAAIFILRSSMVTLAEPTIADIQLGPNMPETVEEAVEMANAQIGHEYFKLQEVNIDVWEKYLTLVYDAPHGDKKGNEYRYLGETPEEEPFTNINFPNDAWAGGYLDDRNWIEYPWNNDNLSGAYWSDFNDKPKYELSIELGLFLYYGDAFKWAKEDWYKCVQVLQPPTDYTFGMGRMWHRTATGIWYITIPMVPLTYNPPYIERLEDIELVVNHYEEGTEYEVYRSDYITNPEKQQLVYAKSGIGLDGSEWICTMPSPQTVDTTTQKEFNFYYTRKETGFTPESQVILTKNPLVTADCKMPGRKNVPDTKGGKHPDGTPLFRGDTFKPKGTIKNPEDRQVFVEYSMTLKDKPDKNYRQIDYKIGEGVIAAGGTKTDNFTRVIPSNDRFGNVYVLTVEASQRIIVPNPPPKPGPKPTKPIKPDRDDYDSASDYYDARDEYRADLENYYEELEEWYEMKEAWDSYVSTWGNPDTGEVHKYKGYWVSDKYGWRTGKGEDMNYVMLNIKQNIEDMDGGLKDSVIVE